jgi:glutamine amidotransferase-like uncharacterized protein
VVTHRVRRRQAGSGPLGLVYRGRASVPGCPEAVGALLERSAWDFEVRFVGPTEEWDLSADLLSRAALYAQPGGGTLRKAYRRLKRNAPMIRDFVGSGGRYAGFCLGGYLAGATPGFGLLPGDTDAYRASSGATVTGTEDTLVPVHWRGRQRWMYFQDGPYFWTRPQTPGLSVLATYPNGEVASLVAPFGDGKVGVVGPHPEAPADWYAEHGLVDPDGVDHDLGLDLIDTLMR